MDFRKQPAAKNSRFKIMVVDDHPHTAHMLARSLSRLGPHVEVVAAADGLEALRLQKEAPADILITDLMMPHMNGMELIEALHAQPDLSPVAAFLLTAYDSAQVREDARRLHVKEVFAKPVPPEWICEVIGKTMDELKQPKTVSPEAAVKNLEMP
jgi:two-component system response regulator YesN